MFDVIKESPTSLLCGAKFKDDAVCDSRLEEYEYEFHAQLVDLNSIKSIGVAIKNRGTFESVQYRKNPTFLHHS